MEKKLVLKYADILRFKKKKKKKPPVGFQQVPMDIGKINASFEATQKPHLV
jgi:hypothetical protein